MERGLEYILSKHELQLSDMKSRCSYSVRVRIAAQLVDWRMIGHYLNFTQVKIHTIQVDNESEEQRRLALLDAWVEMEGERATYLKLAEALYEHGRRDLVEQLCKMIKRALRSDVQSKTPPRNKRRSKSNVPVASASLTSDLSKVRRP